MKFLVNLIDDKFYLADKLTEHCWAEISSVHETDMYQIKYLRFDTKFKFEFASNIYLKYEAIHGSYHTVVNVGIKDSAEDKVYHLDFDSNKPLCVSERTNRCKAFVWFLNYLNQFDSAKDANDVIYTNDVFDYHSPDILTAHIERLAHIVKIYNHSNTFFLQDKIVEWLKQAMLKFGYSFVKLKQLNDNFPEAFNLLNSLGFSATKI